MSHQEQINITIKFLAHVIFNSSTFIVLFDFKIISKNSIYIYIYLKIFTGPFFFKSNSQLKTNRIYYIFKDRWIFCWAFPSLLKLGLVSTSIWPIKIIKRVIIQWVQYISPSPFYPHQKEQDLDTILRSRSLSSSFKILLYKFFIMRRKCIF